MSAPSRTHPHLRLVSTAPEVVEFQSDATEIEERAPPRIACITLYIVAFLIVTAIAWACLSEVDEIAVAPGRLVTTQPNLVVQPLETSVMRSIDVQVGDTVKAGQVLATLDPTFTQADLEQLRTHHAALDAQARRLEAELADLDFTAGAEAPPEEILQARLYAQRQAYLTSQVRNLDAQTARLAANIMTTRSEITVLTQRLSTLGEIETMRETLFASSNGSRLNLLQSRDMRLETEASLARLKGSLSELAQGLEKARAERQAFIDDFRRTALEQLVETRNQRDEAAEQLKKAELRRRMVAITAPADAIVLDTAHRSVGSVVREAEPIFTLVPADAPLEAEVAIDARDVGHVTPKQPVRIKLEAFPFQKHGAARGEVRTVSQDAFSTEGSKEPGKAPALIHRARISLTDTTLRDVPETMHLIPGMTVQAEIKVGRRTVISYFLYPILRGLDESIREPG
ncbi:HlyD family type I secretion periplasmic adaptor subunit [Microvirga massiliensis]|uniref:HlyD family type I secretion periplasmic adaptor subunit n=1 Tax=Microvirga massiliensis TaxID=1033741 RepID=UPI00062BAD27|nr:HlyD family type I secretion periplasmic adaptor subunit [Microvirga massiliensis]